MIALITGVSGFCGRHLVRRLRQLANMRIIGLDIIPAKPETILLDDYVRVDLCDPKGINEAVKKVKPEWVFHLAGLWEGTPAAIYHANLLSGIGLLEAIRLHAPEAHVLIVGSAAEYGYVPECEMPIREDRICTPSGTYALSKYGITLAALDYARNHKMKLVIARPFNIVGPGIAPSLVVGAVLCRAKQALKTPGEPILTVGSLDTERDFIPVQDVMDAYVRMLEGDFWGEVFNICSGEPRSVRSIVEEVLSFSDRPIGLKVDRALLRQNDVKTVYGSWQKANKCFGFHPQTNLRSSLEEAWRFVMERD